MNAAIWLILFRPKFGRSSEGCSGTPIKKPTKEQVKEFTFTVIGTGCFLGFIIYLFSRAVI